MKKWIALLISLLLFCSVMTACGNQEPAQPDASAVVQQVPAEPEEAPEEVPEEAPAEPDPVETPPEAAAVEQAAEPVVSTMDQAVYPEALSVMGYLNALDESGRLRPTDPMTGSQAQLMLTALGLTESSLDADAPTVTAADFLLEAMRLLQYDPAVEGITAEYAVEAAQSKHLLPGLTVTGDTELTVEQAAQILRNALLCSVGGTGPKLYTDFGLNYTILPDIPNGYNAVSGQWTVPATGEAITQPTVAAPLATFGYAVNWCDVLTALGYSAEGSNPMVTFQNTFTGGEFTIKFDKCHWDKDGSGTHSGCANDWTNEMNTTMEVYQVGENEYRNIYKVNFLGKIVDQSITLYGYNSETWGPWAIDTLPENGYYIVTYFWNAYGSGEGLDIVQPAETLVGTLQSIDDQTVVIDGTAYVLSYVFNYGANMAKAPNAIGKTFTFYLDQHGQVVGCGEYIG